MSRFTKIAVPGFARFAVPVVAVLALAGGVAFAAASGSNGNGDSEAGDVRPAPAAGGARAAIPVPPGPHLGPPPFAEGDLAYGELHVVRDGNEVVVRIDRGEVTSASSSEITISEANGDEVTIPVDEDTKVFAGPFRKATLEDLNEGDEVIAHRTGDGAADHVAVLPKKGARGARLFFRRHGHSPDFRHGAVPRPGLRRAPLPAPPGPGFELPVPPPGGNG